MIIVALLLSAANLIFALRALDVVLRSRNKIEPHEPQSELPSLSIIVPARNEEQNIARCVNSLLSTRHCDFEVIVVDDRSTDATRSIVEAIAQRDPRLKIVAGAQLPDGWVGKPWALAQGARVARGAWLLFTDADTEHEPLAATSALQCALQNGYGVVSLLTDQQTIGLAERLLLPTILFVIMLGVGATDDVNDPRKPDVAIFNGQYILVSRVAYDAIGRHEAVGTEIAEDLELARRFKRDGRFRIFLAGAGGLVRTRMYVSFAQIWQGFVKNFAIGAQGRPFGAIAGTTLLACVSPISPIVVLVALVQRQWFAAAVLALSGAAIVAVAEFGMRRARFRPGSGIAVPLGLVVTLAIFATSLYCTFVGRGVEWRGRRYGGGLPRAR
ncbi:MAG: glycosyltransferase family 2 protein [Candidatus Cybelea sp.]